MKRKSWGQGRGRKTVESWSWRGRRGMELLDSHPTWSLLALKGVWWKKQVSVFAQSSAFYVWDWLVLRMSSGWTWAAHLSNCCDITSSFPCNETEVKSWYSNPPKLLRNYVHQYTLLGEHHVPIKGSSQGKLILQGLLYTSHLLLLS